MERKTYPSDGTDDERAFVAPYLILMTQDAPQREHPLREVFNGLRWMVRTGAQWRMLPHDLPLPVFRLREKKRLCVEGCHEIFCAWVSILPSGPTFDG